MNHPNLITLMAVCMTLVSCMSQRVPDANDWETIYRGQGTVGVTVNNQSTCSMFMKIQRKDNSVAAQVELAQMGSETVNLNVGSYGCKLKMISVPVEPGRGKMAMKPGHCYRAPEIEVPANAAHISLTLKIANSTNLEPITDEEFNL